MNGYEAASCSCGAKIRKLPTPTGAMMPVDVGRDPDGNLVAVKIPGKGWGVRVLTAAEKTTGTGTLPRYTAHWSTCPHAEQYRATARLSAPETWPARLADGAPQRSGPCATCRTVHPYHYGPGPSSPLCDPCRAERGLLPVSPLDQSG